MVTASTTLPRWDVTPIYPGHAWAQLRQALTSVTPNVAELVAFVDAHDVHRTTGIRRCCDVRIGACAILPFFSDVA